MKIDVLTAVTSLLDALGIQVTLLSPPYENLPDVDYHLRQKLFEDYNYAELRSKLEQLCQPGYVIHLTDDFKLQYTLFQFPDALAEEYGARYCSAGPFLISRPSSAQFHALMEEKKIPASLYEETMEYYNRVPLIPAFDAWMAQWSVFSALICGEHVKIQFADAGDIGSLHPGYNDYKVNPDPEIALSVIEERYQAEQEMLAAVMAGSTESALILHHKFSQFKIDPRTPDPIRDQKNLQIVLNTLLRKAVQAGYVHPAHIDNLSAQFAIAIESTTSSAQLDKLAVTMVRKYCMLVKNYSRKAYSALVQTSLDYIDFHYADELSLDTMAKLCSVSNSYLSALFKKEVHMTLTDYINSTRIRQSLIMLNSTTMSIQDIAYQCGFLDSNYFTRTFKKFQGKSPKVYREEIRR